MKKLIFKLLLSTILVMAMLFFLGNPLTKINPFADFVKNFNNSCNDGDEYEVYFYGSSKSYSTFNPRIFNEVLEINSFNFGNNGQRLPTTKFVLEETLKKQKPKLLVIELYSESIGSAYSKKNISNQFTSYDAFPFSINKLQHAKEDFPLKELPFLFIKTFRNHQGWKTLKENKIDAQKNVNLVEENNGYRGWQYSVKDAKKYAPLFAVKNMKSNIGEDILDLNQKYNLDQIISVTEKYRIPVLFVTAPSLRELKNKSYSIFSTSLNNYLRSKNQKYLDINYKINSIQLTPHDFRDVIHLNNNGANKVSEFLAKFINKEYGIGLLNSVEAKVERYITDGSFSKSNKFVGRKLTDLVSLKSIDFMNAGNGKMSLIMELDIDNIEDLNQYSIMFHALPEDRYSSFLSQNSINNKRKHEIWDFKPEIIFIDDNYYMVKTIETKIKALKIINLGVYSAENYAGLLYDKITIAL
ncbi:hypothetical protein SAMN04488008_10624 [Maribacter orientalis]|uniref:Uncharacterized protein n=1 Tax=Maribacter orientalis TaxID=228957 RepID=A0A1H7THK4_9FLAO|nr:hypothetical protein [Maribacter orientalis]SEL83816.1 hypothetical protein SAMN04488008_10624 [Maribacter orientalis]